MSDVSRLPGTVSELWDWQLRVRCHRCRTLGSEFFLHPEGERGDARAERDRAAQAVCVDCPVIAECAAHAISVREPYGVWGA
jgi:WhiB family redox-sensing transcriptional regulator